MSWNLVNSVGVQSHKPPCSSLTYNLKVWILFPGMDGASRPSTTWTRPGTAREMAGPSGCTPSTGRGPWPRYQPGIKHIHVCLGSNISKDCLSVNPKYYGYMTFIVLCSLLFYVTVLCPLRLSAPTVLCVLLFSVLYVCLPLQFSVFLNYFMYFTHSYKSLTGIIPQHFSDHYSPLSCTIKCPLQLNLLNSFLSSTVFTVLYPLQFSVPNWWPSYKVFCP